LAQECQAYFRQIPGFPISKPFHRPSPQPFCKAKSPLLAPEGIDKLVETEICLQSKKASPRRQKLAELIKPAACLLSE